MTPLLLGIPLAAILALILLSVGVRPARVAAVWAAVVIVIGAASFVLAPTEGDAAPAPAPAKAARTAAERA